ncbi:MAG: YraN family protein [Actinomycetaceae bacterium]|nr:YraN family protein [Actinomycetaceae bacterium]
MNPREALGQWGENTAARYLESEGYVILERNWRTRGGEIDIVAFDPYRDAIVCVEVKTRRTLSHGSPEESVTPEKLGRLRQLLVAWVMERKQRAGRLAVDVVGLVVLSPDKFQISHAKDVS